MQWVSVCYMSQKNGPLMHCKAGFGNRVFASAQFRGHEKSLRQMPGLIAYLREKQDNIYLYHT